MNYFPNSKVTAVGLVGLALTVVLSALGESVPDYDPELVALLTTAVLTAVGWVKKNTRKAPSDHA